MSIEKTASAYAINCHQSTNHRYDDQDYVVHLQAVVDVARRFSHLLPEKDIETVLAGCWVHDVIEDCRQTYNDVKNATSIPVAEIAYAVTNEKGKNRSERANDKYYQGIRDTEFAVFVKLCDRIANVEYSRQKQNRMLPMYKTESLNFRNKLFKEEYKPMFDHLEQLFQ